MNMQKIVTKIKELLYMEREMSKGGETASVLGHVRLFAVLDLRLEETNKLLSEQVELLKRVTRALQPETMSAVHNGDGDAD